MLKFPGLLCLVLAGCPSAGPRPGPGAAITLVTAAEETALYEVRRPAPLEGLEARVHALVVATAARLDSPTPATDEAAWRTARQIARGLLPEGPPPSVLVEFAMRSNGLVDPPPHLVIASAPSGGESQLLDQLTSRLERILRQGRYGRVGVGVDVPQRPPSEPRLVVALFESRLRFQPLPRQLRQGQRVPLEFELLSNHSSLKLVVADPDGRIATEEPRPVRGRYRASLGCARRGVYQVEVTGEGSHGSEVLANFPVYCQEAPPRTVSYVAGSARLGSEVELEREVFELTNQVRLKLGRSALRYNAELARVARLHSEDMREGRFVGHVSPRTGSPADRLRRAGVLHVAARENVARAYSAGEAVSELMKSPAHRENMLAADVDQIGVGIAIERGGAAPVLLVTQNFMRGGTGFDAATGPAPAYRLIQQGRRGRGLPELRRDADLERLAGVYLQSYLAGGAPAADAALSAALRQLGGRFQQVEGVLSKMMVLEGLSGASELQKKGPTHLGVGVRGDSGQIVVFILLGTARSR